MTYGILRRLCIPCLACQFCIFVLSVSTGHLSLCKKSSLDGSSGYSDPDTDCSTEGDERLSLLDDLDDVWDATRTAVPNNRSTTRSNPNLTASSGGVGPSGVPGAKRAGSKRPKKALQRCLSSAVADRLSLSSSTSSSSSSSMASLHNGVSGMSPNSLQCSCAHTKT